MEAARRAAVGRRVAGVAADAWASPADAKGFTPFVCGDRGGERGARTCGGGSRTARRASGVSATVGAERI